MKDVSFELSVPVLGEYDIAVCGGGIAGFSAAVSAARSGMKTILIESSGYMGGAMTQSVTAHFIDAANKGGIVKEMLDFLNERGFTCPRKGSRVDENGKKRNGFIIDYEGAKYFFDKTCQDAGVEVLYYSKATAVKMKDGRITDILLSTDGGNYCIQSKVFIDATGNGNLAEMAGCSFDCGNPEDGSMQALSMQMVVVGYPEEFNSVDSEAEKTAYHQMLEEYGISTSMGQFGVCKLPSLKSWQAGCNFEFDVKPEDIRGLSLATAHGRMESMETVMKHAQIKGYEGMHVTQTSPHIGIREGRRFYGEYRITLDDIMEGRRFADGICLVTFTVDVHKLHREDTLDNRRGIKTKPYHIPYRSLVPLECSNLLLAGRCLSGDFYPHASYRVMGNMAATGEAAGYAAAMCVKEGISPREVDGTVVSRYMRQAGYEL